MITQEQIDELLQFHNGQFLVTSCYLNLDRGKIPLPALKIRVKDLLQTAQHELAAKAGTHEQRESLQQDFTHIEEYVTKELLPNSHRALAIFSCAGQKFFQAYALPQMRRNILIANYDPYVRPLTAILAEYHRYCTVVIDRVQGRIFEVYMGAMLQRLDIRDDVPRKVREGGLGGRDERGIERRHDHAVQQHFKHLADAVFALFKQNRFDWLILGGHEEVLAAFQQQLHPYLRERWVADFPAEPGKITEAEVLTQTLAIEERVERDLERRLAQELVQNAAAGRRAVAGMTDTIHALGRGGAQMLLVEHGFETPGYACFRCHYPSLDQSPCPQCQQPAEPCADIVDEVIELAMLKNCRIEHVHGPTPLREAGHIGVQLRYQAGV